MPHAGPVIHDTLAVLPTSFAGPVQIETLAVLPVSFAGPVHHQAMVVSIPHFSGPSGARSAIVAPTNVFSGHVDGIARIQPQQNYSGAAEGVARIQPLRGYSGSSGAHVPALPGDTYSGSTVGVSAVPPLRNYGIPTNGYAASLPPARVFGGSTGGVVIGLPAPISLTATVLDAGCIQLDWIDPSNEETGFRVERSLENANDWEIIALLAQDIETYLDRFAVPLIVYDYRVFGFDAVRESQPSNTATAVTGLPPDISTGPPPVAPVDPPRNRLQPRNVVFENPGSYGLEKDNDGRVSGFKF